MQFHNLTLLLALEALIIAPSICNARRLGNNDGEEKVKNEKTKGKFLARANLKDDSFVEFLELENEPGMVVITGELKGAGKKEFKEKKEKKKEKERALVPSNGNGNKKKDEDDPVKLYKRLTGKANAPKELKDAWERAKVKAANEEVEKKEKPEPEDKGGSSSDAGQRERQLADEWRRLEHQWFIDYYCTKPDRPDYCRCYTQRTTSTNGEVDVFTRRARSIESYLDPYRGGLYHEVRYWGCDSGCSRCCFWPFGCWNCNCWRNCYWKDFSKDYLYSSDAVVPIVSYNAMEFDWRFNLKYASGDGWDWSVSTDSVPGPYSSWGYTCPNIY